MCSLRCSLHFVSLSRRSLSFSLPRTVCVRGVSSNRPTLAQNDRLLRRRCHSLRTPFYESHHAWPSRRCRCLGRLRRLRRHCHYVSIHLRGAVLFVRFLIYHKTTHHKHTHEDEKIVGRSKWEKHKMANRKEFITPKLPKPIGTPERPREQQNGIISTVRIPHQRHRHGCPIHGQFRAYDNLANALFPVNSHYAE